MKESIIAFGQFICCYNLLKYFNEKKKGTLTTAETELKKQLLADWEQFNKKPGWLL